ncbi:MAG TPA: hypothetical protein VLE27_04500 [Thermoanaerobaculia bacterium]|nr:hypothetical protein [Thermoanaerobaculia bacterium]
MSKHLTLDELGALFQGNLPSVRTKEVVLHLLASCEPCRTALAAAWREPSTASENTYDLALDRSLKKGRPYARHLRREAARARKVVALLEQGGGLHAVCDRGDLPLRGLGTYQALLERSWAVRHDNLKEMMHLARAAVVVARRLDSEFYEPRLLADLQARAWGELGNAHRAADDLQEAEQAFGRAFELLLQGTGELHLKARLNDLYASFLGTQRRFDLAFAALDIVHATYLDLGDLHLAGRALLTKAIYVHYNGQPEQAIDINETGRTLIEVRREPDLEFRAIHNQIWFLVACGRFREAKKELLRNRAVLEKMVGRVSAIKLRWLQGQIRAGLDEWKSAEIALLEVKEGFERLELGLAAALVSLELAFLWMRQNRLTETEELVRETFEVFSSLKIHREAIGAMQVLNEARERKIMTVTLLDSVVKYLHRAQHDPDVPFVPKWE